MTPEQPVTERVRIRVTGTVQGVGFRPFAVALAGRLGLVGYVGNDPGGVVLEAQGDPHALAELHREEKLSDLLDQHQRRQKTGALPDAEGPPSPAELWSEAGSRPGGRDA